MRYVSQYGFGRQALPKGDAVRVLASKRRNALEPT